MLLLFFDGVNMRTLILCVTLPDEKNEIMCGLDCVRCENVDWQCGIHNCINRNLCKD